MKVNKEGIGLLSALGVVLLAINISMYSFTGAGWLFGIVLVFCVLFYLLVLNFFRQPKRVCPCIADQHAIIAPADGRIVAIEEVEEVEILGERRLQVSIFMSVFNVHANWFPCHGIVEYVSHHEGRFMAAYLPKSSTENERSSVVIRTLHGNYRLLVRQIAGALARRIVTYGEPGDNCNPDQHLGFIKFGSRVDLYLPLGSQVKVQMDQPVVGNQTVIAYLPQNA
ncbi:phosphatidylserine decarboxylase [Porphyromonas crevioricanis]|uniref:Phosphatidylserine decarboxylase proenzyme n=2 Tax=Porphyromonas crevioricanis TaxID=393921 RepID=A0A0A2FFB4_9PORP|nr:phosphatidylserine decarboxylase family protein [Porphyromonas crevioricanis]KGN88730.1 phosphatidylserine decarboxylase [Porphyromonas crevioricanis]KGN93900.1 phosphatidylserine decarboxylase [Porphyromonas crevioricanis]SJZ89224.1 phosphatidylserine decarboxylase [Porphyromonas crevioricanis]SQH73654.1 phosphatidylserine decarboxylase [Porphyromonas crevioricanis]GAD05433.1 phosphatidylserine decarboxylase [Porphyromonas crevioricanis JCM 15906]